MAGAPTPQVLLEAIAANAAAGALPGNKTAPMPETQPGTINAASIQTGFNANTMTNENAGGRPVLGPDMNGMFFLVSSHTLYIECGQTYKYNSDLATAIGGYLAGTVLGMTDNSGLWLNLTDGNTTDPDANGDGWVPMAAYGFANIAGLTTGTVTLTKAQAKFGVIILDGILTGNITINFPQTKQQWLVINRTSGAFTTTAKTASGGSVGQTIPQGGLNGPFGIYSIGDGNIYPTVPPLGVAIDQNPTPLTIVERTNAGHILANYIYSAAPVETPPIGNVIVTQTGNNFFQKITLTNFELQLLLQGIGGQVVNSQVPFSVVAQWASALFSSPAFSGVPTTPTAAAGTSNSQVASTAFANPGVTVNGNGICIFFPSGAKLQAGTCNPNGGAAVVTFPVPFTSQVFPTAISVAGGSVQTWLPAAPALTGMTVRNTGGSSIWIAAGI